MKLDSKKLIRPSVSKAIKDGAITYFAGTERREVTSLLAEAYHKHPWTFATVDVVSRSVIGAGWKFVPHPKKEGLAKDGDLERLNDFFDYSERRWDNIKDFQSLSNKLSHTVSSYRLLGHTAWEIIYSKSGNPLGFDVLSGVTLPNVEDDGRFKKDAFTYYAWGKSTGVSYARDEIAYFYNPGATGSVFGESPYEALAHTSLPSDLFAATAYRQLFENRNAPYNGVWQVDPSVSNEDFDAFLGVLEDRYTGAMNYGRNPLVIRGAAEFKQMVSTAKEDAPYLEGRAFNREEFFGVTGVDGNKVGITEYGNKSNIRETRRDYHENTLRPLFVILEEGIYHQVIRRVLGIEGWILKFNRPDITNALEQSAIDKANMQFGVYSPNEVRIQKGEKPRPDGDFYYMATSSQEMMEDAAEQAKKQSDDQTHGARGRNAGPNDPGGNSDTGESGSDSGNITLPSGRPPRDEEHPDSMNSLRPTIIGELKTWRRLKLMAMDGKKESKPFKCNAIPTEVAKTINEMLDEAEGDFELVKRIFEGAMKAFE